MRVIIVLLIIFQCWCISAQPNGYWDKERSTYKELVVNARDRIVLPIEELPEGTTEIIYRITLLDENQQLSNSLVSVLKALPDPTGISQGTAGAILLLSNIAGKDQCRYAIFTSKEKALQYVKDGNPGKACLYQNKDINKDARRITIEGTTCFKSNKMWFGFESKNWLLNQKIILEVVPWVDTELSKGWNTSHKEELFTMVKNLPYYKALYKKDDFAACYLAHFMKRFTHKEYKRLLGIEVKRVSDSIAELCLTQTGENVKPVNLIREKAMAAFESGKYDLAIEIMKKEIVDVNKAVAMDYYTLGDFYLLTKQFTRAEDAFNSGLELDPNEINLQLELAHVYMLTDRVSEAKEIHKKYKEHNVFPTISWKQKAEQDFELFEKYGLPTSHFRKIRKVLK